MSEHELATGALDAIAEDRVYQSEMWEPQRRAIAAIQELKIRLEAIEYGPAVPAKKKIFKKKGK